jgi:cold shock CspA family protein
MAKSKETFNKKEKEKKKQQKRQEKREKKEERHANARNGNNLNEMMAYVDENGNLSAVPPDPSKKVVIDVSEIQIGVTRQEETEADLIRSGTVTMFNDQKGYGFIEDMETKESVFVHINSLNIRIQQNDKVLFETEKGLKGKVAVNVRKKV